MYDDLNGSGKNIAKEEQEMPQVPEKESKLCNKRFYNRIKSAEAMFLAAAEELLNRDVILAQHIISLNKNIVGIKNLVKGDGSTSFDLCCQKCTGINEGNFSDDLDDCFEITEFHIQLGKGKEIIILHKLRCALREIISDAEELADRGGDKNQKYQEMIAKANQIVNTLSQLICSTVGGEKCQRKL